MVEVIENAKPEDWQVGDIVEILTKAKITKIKDNYVYYINLKTNCETYFYCEPKSFSGEIITIRRQSEADKIRAEIARLQARLIKIEPEAENATPPQHVFDAAEGFGQYFKSQLPPPPANFGEWILHEGNCYPLDGDAREFEGVVLFKDGTISEPAKFWCWQHALSNPIIAYALPLKQNGGGA